MQQELLVVNSVRCHMCVCLWNCHFFPGGIFLQDFGSLGANGSGKRHLQQHYRVFSIFEQKREDTLQNVASYRTVYCYRTDCFSNER